MACGIRYGLDPLLEELLHHFHYVDQGAATARKPQEYKGFVGYTLSERACNFFCVKSSVKVICYYFPILGWKTALNHFAVMFEGRIPTRIGK